MVNVANLMLEVFYHNLTLLKSKFYEENAAVIKLCATI